MSDGWLYASATLGLALGFTGLLVNVMFVKNPYWVVFWSFLFIANMALFIYRIIKMTG